MHHSFTQSSTYFTMAIAGDIVDLSDVTRIQMQLLFAQTANVALSNVELGFPPGSVIITAKIVSPSPDAAANLTATLANELATPESATHFFANVGGIRVLSISSVTTITEAVVAYPPPPSPPPLGGTSEHRGMSGGAIAAIVIGALLGSATIACLLVSNGNPSRKPAGDDFEGPSLTLTDLSNQNAEV